VVEKGRQETETAVGGGISVADTVQQLGVGVVAAVLLFREATNWLEKNKAKKNGASYPANQCALARERADAILKRVDNVQAFAAQTFVPFHEVLAKNVDKQEGLLRDIRDILLRMDARQKRNGG
jgi:hypothetical protein